jgi:hypothetical protein
MSRDISALNTIDPMIINEAPAAAIIPSFPHDVPTLVGVFGEEGCFPFRITPPARAIIAFPRRLPVSCGSEAPGEFGGKTTGPGFAGRVFVVRPPDDLALGTGSGDEVAGAGEDGGKSCGGAHDCLIALMSLRACA